MKRKIVLGIAGGDNQEHGSGVEVDSAWRIILVSQAHPLPAEKETKMERVEFEGGWIESEIGETETKINFRAEKNDETSSKAFDKVFEQAFQPIEAWFEQVESKGMEVQIVIRKL